MVPQFWGTILLYTKKEQLLSQLFTIFINYSLDVCQQNKAHSEHLLYAALS